MTPGDCFYDRNITFQEMTKNLKYFNILNYDQCDLNVFGTKVGQLEKVAQMVDKVAQLFVKIAKLIDKVAQLLEKVAQNF